MARRKRLTLPDPEEIAAREPVARDVLSGGPRRAAPIADVAGDVAARAAMEEIAGEMTTARREGRLVMALPLEAVDEGHLIRDRITVTDEDQTALLESLRRRGQQAPIEVVELEQGRYGLISGWRRLTALRTLLAETKEDRFGTVQALVRPPRAASEAYVAMVEENEIRANLSFYERARIAARGAEQGAFETPREAVKTLFASASRAKRSKINSFLVLYQTLDGVLRYPQAISERMGLALVQRLSADTGFAKALSARLQAADPQDAEREQDVIAQALRSAPRTRTETAETAETAETPPAPASDAPPVMVAKPGRIVLTGTALDAALAADLQEWLASRLGVPVKKA